MSSFDAEDGHEQPPNNQRISYPAVDVQPVIVTIPNTVVHHHPNNHLVHDDLRSHPCQACQACLLPCFTIVWILVWLVVLGVIAGMPFFLWFVTAYSVYTDYSPEFQIDSISVSPPNISNSQISTNWTMGIMVTNPNKRSHIVYDGLEVLLFYEADQNLCSTRIAPFRQGPKNTTTLVAESQACLQDLNDHLFAGVTESAAGPISNDLRGGIGDFNVKLRVRHRYVIPLWPGKNWIHKDFDCLNIKVLFASDGTSSKILGCKNCF